jgi:hypothetical protein
VVHQLLATDVALDKLGARGILAEEARRRTSWPSCFAMLTARPRSPLSRTARPHRHPP